MSARLAEDIEHEEGRKRPVYLDTKGIPTVGIGHTGPDVHPGEEWADARIDEALAGDIAEALDGIRASAKLAPAFNVLDDIRSDVLAQMVFQMGARGVEGFKNMLSAILALDYASAAAHGLDSDWARHDSPNRARRQMWQLKHGQRVWADLKLADDVGHGRVPV